VSIRLTKEAAAQILSSAKHSSTENQPLRIAAQRNQLTGSISYAMGFDDQQDIDTASQQHGVEIIVAPMSADLLSGVILDFIAVDGETEKQFVFLNPNDPDFVPPSAK
tara:strand:+ start:1473 stop:1796 length:324 start_codon:yes stop_codon:yes gene_type:complete